METNLKRLIRERGLKQKWVAEQAGVSHAAMSALVNGRSEPTLRTARALARVLDTTVDDLWPVEEAQS